MAKNLAEHNPGRKIFSSKIATVVVWVTTFIWTVPTLGLLVTSFKADKDICKGTICRANIEKNRKLLPRKRIHAKA